MGQLSSEIPVTIRCGDSTLIGMVHRPSVDPTIGMVIVVGGPQYRVGSHRLFVSLARDLSARGIAVLRFDCRGMGDSEGEFPGFTKIEADIEAAVSALICAVPSVAKVALWALCDGASAICMYGHKDRRIAGIALINPWVRTEAVHARAYLKHYYWRRLVDPTFLRKLASGQWRVGQSAHSLLDNLLRAMQRTQVRDEEGSQVSLPQRMANSLQRFRGAILIVLAGQDLTAREFEDVVRGSRVWQRILDSTRVQRHELDAADHTFSRRVWYEQLTAWTWHWLSEVNDSDRERPTSSYLPKPQ